MTMTIMMAMMIINDAVIFLFCYECGDDDGFITVAVSDLAMCFFTEVEHTHSPQYGTCGNNQESHVKHEPNASLLSDFNSTCQVC